MHVDDIRDQFTGLGLHLPRFARIPGGLLPGHSDAGEYLVVAGLLPIPDPREASPGACGTIAPFAAVHHYRLAAAGLRRLAADLRRDHGLAKADIRIFSNSRLPERSIAAALGLGWVGRNGLLMNHEYGSSFVLAGILVDTRKAAPPIGGAEKPGTLSSLVPPADPHARCGSCRACSAACPVAAVRPGGGIEVSRCLQYLSTSPGPLPSKAEAAWGRRIYGCQECQKACPVNRQRSYRAPLLPPGKEHRSLAVLLEGFADPAVRLKTLFPDTALEAGWIPRDAILRNLMIASGNSGHPELIDRILRIKSTPAGTYAGYVHEAAHRAIARLRRGAE